MTSVELIRTGGLQEDKGSGSSDAKRRGTIWIQGEGTLNEKEGESCKSFRNPQNQNKGVRCHINLNKNP